MIRFNTDGTLDGTFDGDGRVTVNFDLNFEYGTSVAIQNDNKIVVAGTSSLSPYSYFALARFNTDGSPDNTFSIDGKLLTKISDTVNNCKSVAIAPDGKIVAAGTCAENGTSYFAAVRYNPDGTLDETFDADGKTKTDFEIGEAYTASTSMLVQPDKMIVIGGYTYTSESGNEIVVALARFNESGSLDTAFGSFGKVETKIAGMNLKCQALAIQPDGRILAVGDGRIMATSDYDFYVFRYKTGLHLWLMDPQMNAGDIRIYPNPVQGSNTLEYELLNEDNLTIYLTDMQGRIINTFVDGKHRSAGTHTENIDMPDLPKGTYILTIRGKSSLISLKVLK